MWKCVMLLLLREYVPLYLLTVALLLYTCPVCAAIFEC